jgi:hypothetical protein
MGIGKPEGIVRWEGFELEIRTGELRRTNGKTVRLSDKPLRILIALAERPGELVTSHRTGPTPLVQGVGTSADGDSL